MNPQPVVPDEELALNCIIVCSHCKKEGWGEHRLGQQSGPNTLTCFRQNASHHSPEVTPSFPPSTICSVLKLLEFYHTTPKPAQFKAIFSTIHPTPLSLFCPILEATGDQGPHLSSVFLAASLVPAPITSIVVVLIVIITNIWL